MSDGVTLLVGNIYGPNEERDKGQFFEMTRAELDAFPRCWILGGDFNMTLNDGERKRERNEL